MVLILYPFADLRHTQLATILPALSHTLISPHPLYSGLHTQIAGDPGDIAMVLLLLVFLDVT